jgi:hypothetical protein
MVNRPGLATVNVSGKDIKAAITDDCAVLTVIDYRTEWVESNPLLEHLTEQELIELSQQVNITRRGGIDVREHDSLMDALKYIKDEGDVINGNWDRIYIINPERLRYTEKQTKRGRRR